MSSKKLLCLLVALSATTVMSHFITLNVQAAQNPDLVVQFAPADEANHPSQRSSWGRIKALYRGEAELQGESEAGLNQRTVTPMMIGTKRNSVRNEFWYALDRGWLTKPDDPTGPPGPKSNWNWLSKTADANANGLRFALNRFQTCVSNDIPPWCNCCRIDNPTNGMKYPQNTVEYWVNYLSADSYGVRGGIGRGTQCVAFVAMLLYRASGGSYRLTWSWSEHTSSTDRPASQAQVGDIVYYNFGANNQHIGICVTRDANGMTVGDSNYIGYETIGRHYVTNAQMASWRSISGAGVWY